MSSSAAQTLTSASAWMHTRAARRERTVPILACSDRFYSRRLRTPDERFATGARARAVPSLRSGCRAIGIVGQASTGVIATATLELPADSPAPSAAGALAPAATAAAAAPRR